MKSSLRILSLLIVAGVLAAVCGCYNTCTLKKRSERRDGASFTASMKAMNNP